MLVSGRGELWRSCPRLALLRPFSTFLYPSSRHYVGMALGVRTQDVVILNSGGAHAIPLNHGGHPLGWEIFYFFGLFIYASIPSGIWLFLLGGRSFFFILIIYAYIPAGIWQYFMSGFPSPPRGLGRVKGLLSLLYDEHKERVFVGDEDVYF